MSLTWRERERELVFDHAQSKNAVREWHSCRRSMCISNLNVTFSSIPEIPLLQTTCIQNVWQGFYLKRKLRPIRLRALVCRFFIHCTRINWTLVRSFIPMPSKFPSFGNVQKRSVHSIGNWSFSKKRAISSIHFNNLIVAIDCENFVKHVV